jgi:hypothetical protein
MARVESEGSGGIDAMEHAVGDYTGWKPDSVYAEKAVVDAV